MEYYKVSINGGIIHTLSDREHDFLFDCFDTELHRIGYVEAKSPVVLVEFYVDYKGNTIYVEKILEEDDDED